MRQNKHYSTTQVQELLGISRARLRRWTEAGHVEVVLVRHGLRQYRLYSLKQFHRIRRLLWVTETYGIPISRAVQRLPEVENSEKRSGKLFWPLAASEKTKASFGSVKKIEDEPCGEYSF